MKTFLEHLTEDTSADLQTLNEALQAEWTPELEARVDQALEEFANEYQNANGQYDIQRLNEEITNEGVIGSIFGGLTGFALGKTVGKLVAKVLGVEEGVMYDMLTSRLVGAALGSAIAKKF